MPTNYTPNYRLNQWERSDKVLMDDFNADNAKVDAALKEHTSTLAAQASLLAKCGNCAFHHGTYIGTGGLTGEDYPTSYTLPWKPDLVIIIGESSLAILPYGETRSMNRYGTTTVFLSVSWSGNTLSWYTFETTSNTYVQLNAKGTTYHVFSFAAKA